MVRLQDFIHGCVCVSVYDHFYCTAVMNGTFTPPDTETKTDKMGTNSMELGVLVCVSVV